MDIIFINGKIETMSGCRVPALAIADGLIAAVGSDTDVLALKTPGCEVIDLGGRLVLPGFTDTHMHMLYTGADFGRLDLRGVLSAREIIERGREYIRKNAFAPGHWVIGYGFDHNGFDPPELPGLETGNAISTEHPVLLERICGHVGTANSMALSLAGIDENSAIPGGVIDKNAGGAITGVLRETALYAVKARVPRPTQTEVEAMLQEAGARFAAAGLTAVHSDDLGSEGVDWQTFSNAVAALEKRGEMRVRIHEEMIVTDAKQLRALIDSGFTMGFGNDSLRLCNIKIITDGSLGARTAYLREDYSDEPGSRGLPVYTQAELDELISLCHEAGLQTACHAIGDGAAKMCVNAVEKAMAARKKDLRHRIVHCQIGDLAHYERMGALGMGADIQPAFTATDALLVNSRLGARSSECYAWKTLMDRGVTVGGSSDSPVESFNPLWGIYCAVTRSNAEGAPPWMPEQRLTVRQAVSLYTVNAARLGHQEDRAGTIDAGKLADIVVLDADIFSIPAEAIRDVRPVLTLRGGKISYEDAFWRTKK